MSSSYLYHRLAFDVCFEIKLSETYVFFVIIRLDVDICHPAN